MLIVPGCGGEESRDESELLPPEVGAPLASRLESVRASVAGGANCTAQKQAAQLERDVAHAIEQNRVPPALQDELRRRSSALSASIECVQPPPPPPPPPPPIPRDEEGEEEDD